MQIGCCTGIENYELVVRNNYDRIVLPAVKIATMDQDAFVQTKKLLSQGTLQCRSLNWFCTPALKLCGDGYSEEAVAAYMPLLVQRASEIGVEYIGVGSPKSRNIPEGFSKDTAMEQFKRSMDVICEACRPYGITVLLEAVCTVECNFITTTDEALAVMKSLDIDNLKFVFDSYHAFMMGEDDKPLRRAMPYVRLVHVAQNIDSRRHYLRSEKMDEYRVYFKALMEAGYDGEVSIEAFYDDMEEQLGPTLSILKTLCLNK